MSAVGFTVTDPFSGSGPETPEITTCVESCVAQVSVTGYCYGTGYNARSDAKVYSNIWIYVSANGHFGYATSLWFTSFGST